MVSHTPGHSASSPHDMGGSKSTGTELWEVLLFSADTLKVVLSLYMEGSQQPLPSTREVLLCDRSTTAEQVKDSFPFTVKGIRVHVFH